MKKIFMAGLLSLILLVDAPSVNASNWVELGPMSNNGEILSIDADSIHPISGTRYAMWYKVTEPDGKYHLIQCYCDSSNQAITFVSFINYNKDGTVIDSVTIPSYMYELNWAPVAPDTIGEILYKCATGAQTR